MARAGNEPIELQFESPVVSGEDAREYRAWIDEWRAHHRPTGPAESVLMERAALAAWRLKRCARVEAARCAQRVRLADSQFERDEHARVEALRHQLDLVIDSYVQPHRASRHGVPIANPTVVLRELRAFAAGADFLIGRWKALQGVLESEGKWGDSDHLRAILLLGKHPQQSLEDEDLTALCVACYTTTAPQWDLWGHFSQIGAIGEGQALCLTRIDALEQARNPDPVAARAVLAALAAREIRGLEALKAEQLDALAALDRAEAADRAWFDDSKAGAALRKFETTLNSDLRQSLRELARLQNARKAAPPSQPDTKPDASPAPVPSETGPEQPPRAPVAVALAPKRPALPRPRRTLDTPTAGASSILLDFDERAVRELESDHSHGDAAACADTRETIEATFHARPGGDHSGGGTRQADEVGPSQGAP